MKEASEICLKCGVCCVVRAHFCHVQYEGKFDAKNTYVYNLLKDDEPTKNPNIWMCVSCHKCEELCPYEVSPVNFIEAIKSQALVQGNVHPMILGELENITTLGYAFPLTGSSKRQRERLGLEPLKLEAAEDLKIIAEKTSLTKKISSAKED
jgi:heterodisulfide reductase subunit C